MSSSFFDITEHIIPCAHIREYHDSVKDETVSLQLAIKEYRPLNNLQPEPGSVTMIATTPNAFPKVCKSIRSKASVLLIANPGMLRTFMGRHIASSVCTKDQRDLGRRCLLQWSEWSPERVSPW